MHKATNYPWVCQVYYCPHGEQRFPDMPLVFWACANCRREWMDVYLIRLNESVLKQEIKKRLGVDWDTRKPKRKSVRGGGE